MKISDVAIFAEGFRCDRSQRCIGNEVCDGLGIGKRMNEVMLVTKNECGDFEPLEFRFLNTGSIDRDPRQELGCYFVGFSFEETFERLQVIGSGLSKVPRGVATHESGIGHLWRMRQHERPYLSIGKHVWRRGFCDPRRAREDQSTNQLGVLDRKAK